MVSQPVTLTEEQIEEFKQAFSIFAKDCEGTITMKELRIVMGSAGMQSISYNMHEDAIKQFIEEVENTIGENIDINQFLEVMEKKI